MAIDFDNITHGPAVVTLDSTELGHTSGGGVAATIAPQNRPRTVDKFGNSACAIIHTGDQCRAAIPFAEWTYAMLQEVYQPGTAGTTYVGLGRSAGFIYPQSELQIAPRLAADAAKLILFWKVSQIGDFEIGHNADDDRIFECEFEAQVDESKTDGELIGKIAVS